MSTGGPGPQAGPGEPGSGVLFSCQDVVPEDQNQQSVPSGLTRLGSGWTVRGHAARRWPRHFVSGGHPSSLSFHVLCLGL